MYFNPEGSTLYPDSWEYNGCRIIKALARVIENHGGRVSYSKSSHGFIVNRSILEAVRKYSAREKALKAALSEGRTKNPEVTRAALISTQKDLDNIININNDPIEIFNGLYISFIIDNYYYSLSLNENPFFDFYYVKTPVNNNRYSRDAALHTFNKTEWLYDCFFEYRAADADCMEAANIIFNSLMNAKNSDIIRDSRRERVANRYDGKYHYETIYAPERFATIDF